jgi:ABC-2 type transport system ATP-binding protein
LYGERVAVDGVSLRIGAGETYGLLGPNGAGKTTTISMICGLLQRDDGEIHVGGVDLDDDPLAARAVIGYVPQEIALYDDLTAVENLRFFGRLQGLPSRRLGSRIESVLEVIGLADRARDRVESFSGGMKRRLNIAVGMLHEPHLLVLDEPTVGVDPQSRNAILESVAELGALGLAVLYTTHYMEEAERLCDRIGILDEGRMVAEGTRDELIGRIGENARVRLTGEGPLASMAQDVRPLDGVLGVEVHDDTLTVMSPSAHTVLPRLLEAAERDGVRISGLDITEPDLEAVFLHLTGKALRD